MSIWVASKWKVVFHSLIQTDQNVRATFQLWNCTLTIFRGQTLLPHTKRSFDSASSLYITSCRKLRYHEHPTCRSVRTLVCHTLSPTNHFDDDSGDERTLPKLWGAEKKHKNTQDPFVTFHQWHVRAMFMQIGGGTALTLLLTSTKTKQFAWNDWWVLIFWEQQTQQTSLPRSKLDLFIFV